MAEAKKPGLTPEQETLSIHLTAIMEVLKDATIKQSLTVLTNLAGQLVAQMAGGNPTKVQGQMESVAKAIYSSAMNKIMWDDEARRQKDSAEKAAKGDTS